MKAILLKSLFLVLSIACAFGHLFVPHIAPSLPGTYTAFAHLYVGCLLMGWAFPPAGLSRRTFWIPLGLLTTAEVLAFFATA